MPDTVALPKAPEITGLADPNLVQTESFIGGAWRSGKAIIDVRNPSDGSVIGSVARMTPADATAAVDAAHAAFAGWADTLPQERARIMRQWYELLIAHKEDLARIMVMEQGKPISEALGEIDYAASFIEFYGEEAKRPNLENATSHLPDAEMEIWREPIGVAALITPWNFPSAMITRKAAAAIAAGCTVVVHPSKETPYSALALAELAHRAGVPGGVFNVITGEPAEIVEPWTEDNRVRALSFTGSTEIGRLLYRQCAGTVKRLIMELGGHAPLIVFDDADLDEAVDEAIGAKFATSGQDCLAANRILVQRGVYDDFCASFAAKTAKLSVGPGLDDPDIGPLMNENAIAKQVEHVDDAVNKGAKLMTGGKVHPAGDLFFEPTVLTDVPDDAMIFREETFGPVAGIAAFDDEDEAVRRANDTEYGLVAYVHTLDPRRIYRMSRALSFGMVAVNRSKVTGPPIPFGGVKQSGLDREGGRPGMDAYTEIKYVCRDWQ